MTTSSVNKVLSLLKDTNGNVFFGTPFSPVGYDVILVVATAQSLTVPENVDVAIFSYGTGNDVWVNPTTTATIPSATFTLTTQDLNPVVRAVIPGETLSFISSSAAAVKVSFYTTQKTGFCI